MGFWQSVNNALQTVSGSSVVTKPQTMDEVLLDTAESHLAMESKLKTLNALNEVTDMEILRKDDRDKVRQYEMHKTPWRKAASAAGGGEEDMGHILGDVTIQQAPNKKPVSGLMVPLATIAMLGFLGNKLLDMYKDVGQQPQTPVAQPGDDMLNDVNVGFGTPEYKSQEEPSEL